MQSPAMKLPCDISAFEGSSKARLNLLGVSDKLPHMDTPSPILIAGPTASGKSALSLKLSKDLNGVIINADALQVYGLWRVLTARPSEADEALAPHRLYGHVPPSEAYSVGAWLRDLDRVLNEIRQNGQRPIIIGGTGLYFSALTNGLAEIPEIPTEVRAEGDALRAKGAEAFATLETDDPATWARIDRNNPARLQRAWEVLRATGRKLSDWQADTSPPLVNLENSIPICLDVDRDWLGARIDQRFDLMLSEGALSECQAWMDQGLSMELPSAKALGAPEIIAHLNGEMSLEDARDRATIATRQFAKRQRTWFRSKMGEWEKLDIASLGAEQSAQLICDMASKGG